jgi:O-antigen biosynthesis protein
MASVEDETHQLFNTAKRDSRVTVIGYDAPFNFSAICNLGARSATGSLLLMLNNDVEIIRPNWLSELVAQLSRPGVGSVGAKLL